MKRAQALKAQQLTGGPWRSVRSFRRAALRYYILNTGAGGIAIRGAALVRQRRRQYPLGMLDTTTTDRRIQDAVMVRQIVQ